MITLGKHIRLIVEGIARVATSLDVDRIRYHEPEAKIDLEHIEIDVSMEKLLQWKVDIDAVIEKYNAEKYK